MVGIIVGNDSLEGVALMSEAPARQVMIQFGP